jgi:hypothetical protein
MTGTRYVPTESGRWVDSNFAYLAEIIQEIYPFLVLAYIPPERLEPDDTNQYCILDIRINKPIMFADRNAKPEEILERLFLSDQSRGNVQDRLDARNRAAEMLRLKGVMEQMEEANELATFLLKTKKNFIDFTNSQGDKVLLDDQLRTIRRRP